MNSVTEYLKTKDVEMKFKWCSRTIYRKMSRKNNPFPSPRIKCSGASNLWAVEDVKAWEEREWQQCA